MRKYPLLAAIIAITFLVLGAPEAKAAPRSYPMTCRGGGVMRANFSLHKEDRATLSIHFKKGTAGAGVRAPRPGECTWIDRGLRPNEPKVIKLWIKDVTSVKFSCKKGSCRYGGSNNRNANYLMNAVQRGEPFQVHVYNIENMSSRGLLGMIKRVMSKGFRVTRVGP